MCALHELQNARCNNKDKIIVVSLEKSYQKEESASNVTK